MKSLFPLLLSLCALGCLSPVADSQCTTERDCPSGQSCIDARCRTLMPGGGGSASGGGNAAGGSSTAGGGDAVGGGDAFGGGFTTGGGGIVAGGGTTAGGGLAGGGFAQGGGLVGGGSGGGMACGCRTSVGCSAGDSPFACGTGGAMCQRCRNGEQCVSGACVMAACGPGTCSGCCARGTCITPSMQQPFTCGANGAMCVQCNNGESCVNGSCQVAPPCGPMTCLGCCQQSLGAPVCVPPTSQTTLNCGAGGLTCSLCPRNSQCVSGRCVQGSTDGGSTGSCNPTNCAGCCQATPAGTFCVQPSMQGTFACGSGGMSCMRCAGGSQCNAGTCSGGTPVDGGPLPPPPPPLPADAGTGDPCTAQTRCEGNICIQETMMGFSTGYTGGYCSANCQGGAPCASGVCVDQSFAGQMFSTCHAACTGTGQGSCRAGYVCTPGSAGSFCRPDCNNGGLAACTSGTCQASGYCQ